MGTTKLNIGKIPISKGEYKEGTAYQRLNQVTMLGSTYQSKIDDNTSAPAQMGADGAVENINTDKWLCVAVGNVSAAKKVVYNNETSGLEAGNVQEAIDETNNKVTALSDKQDEQENYLNQSDLGNFNVVDEFGNIGLHLNEHGELIFKELFSQFIDKLNKAGLPLLDNKFDVTSFISSTLADNDKKSPSLSLFKNFVDLLLQYTASIFVSGNNFSIVDKEGNVGFYIDENGHTMFDLSYIREKFGIFESGQIGTIVFADDEGNIGVKIDNKGRFYGNIDVHQDVVFNLPSYINILSDTEYRLFYEAMLPYAFVEGFKIHESKEDDFSKRNYFLIYKNKYNAGSINRLDLFVDDLRSRNLCIKSTNVRCVDKTTKGSLVVSLIGDSKSQNRSKQAEILNLCQKDTNLTVDFVGSYKSSGTDSNGVSHEIYNDGYGGATILNFLDMGSSYYDSSIEGYTLPSGNKYKFSCEHAFATFSKVPNIVWIDMGANQRSSNWEDINAAYEFIFEDIKKYNKSHSTTIKVVVSIQEGNGLLPALNFDIGGKWYQYRNVTTLKELASFDNREDEGIFICPQYLFVDYYNDYPMTDVPVDEYNKSMRRVSLDNTHLGINMNAYNSESAYKRGDTVNHNGKGYLSLIDNNRETPSDDKVHWAQAIDTCVNAGYYHIAKANFATLKYIASLIN